MTTHPDRPRVLLLPGWLNSGPGHWQSRWEALHGFERVEQSDWLTPRRGDWMARLDEVLLQDQRPVVLVAHSLGCMLTAAWAGHSQHTARVRGALLVAPPDLARDDMPPQVTTWRPVPAARLPFPATLVFSSDDPYCSAARAAVFATTWGATPHAIGARGHVNDASGLADWPEGLALLAGWGVLPAPAA
jgi:predicted alpha/beta hydrolase family esterase